MKLKTDKQNMVISVVCTTSDLRTYIDKIPDVYAAVLRARQNVSVTAADYTVNTKLAVYMTCVSAHAHHINTLDSSVHFITTDKLS